MSSLTHYPTDTPPINYFKKYIVRYSETGSNGRLTCLNILNYFQDIASDHAGLLGISALDLYQKKLAWVIHKLQLQINAYPKWDHPIFLSTWRYPFRNLYELRAFEGKDSDDNVLFTGKCAWVMVQWANKKPVRLNRYMSEELLNNHIEIAYDFPVIGPLVEQMWESDIVVKMHHLDFNQHVNNVVYLQWAMENLPMDIQKRMMPYSANILFAGDAILGDRLKSSGQCIDHGETFVHQMTSANSENELTRIQTQWKAFDYGSLL